MRKLLKAKRVLSLRAEETPLYKRIRIRIRYMYIKKLIDRTSVCYKKGIHRTSLLWRRALIVFDEPFKLLYCKASLQYYDIIFIIHEMFK